MSSDVAETKPPPPQKRKLYQTNLRMNHEEIYPGAAKVLQRTTEDTQVQFILVKNTTCSIAHQRCHILG